MASPGVLREDSHPKVVPTPKQAAWSHRFQPVQAHSTKLLSDLPPISPLGMDSVEGERYISQECFLPPRGGFNLPRHGYPLLAGIEMVFWGLTEALQTAFYRVFCRGIALHSIECSESCVQTTRDFVDF